MPPTSIIPPLARGFGTLDVAVFILMNKMFALQNAPEIIFRSTLLGTFSMIFVIEIFGEPDSHGNARVIERRTHTGPTVTEALRTARANLRTPPPSAYSFSMWADGKEVGRWQKGDDGHKADVLGDLKSAKSRSRAGDDE
jgi:hypothetical protein